MSHRLGLKVVRSACSVGLFVVALASLLGFFSDASDQALPSSQSRRLRSHRHARDEIDWPEGNKRHAHSASETAEQSSARQELHRQAYLAEKRLPLALQRASREGNSKKDRARASAAEKRLGEIEHALAKENERLRVVDRDSHGLARYFPEVNLKEEEKVYAAMRGIRGKGKANHNKRAENIMAKQKRKAAFEALRDKNIREQYGIVKGSDSLSDGSDALLRRPPPINSTLDKYAPSWRKARRQKFLKRQAANQEAASQAPEALEAAARQVYEARRNGRLERAAHLIADLEAQAADGEGPGARAAARHLRWISKLSSSVFAQWGEPLVVLIVRVHDAGAFNVEYRGRLAVQPAEEAAAAAQSAHGEVGAAAAAAALAAVDATRRRVLQVAKARREVVWPRLEASLRQMLAQLARVGYLGDEVDLEIVLELDPIDGQDDGDDETMGQNEGGSRHWGLTRLYRDSTSSIGESSSSGSGNDDDASDISGEKSPEREGEGGKGRPLPSQVECLAAADSFVWPHGAMKVRVAWRTPPPPPLSPAAAAAAAKKKRPPGGVYKPPNIHLWPGGPIGKQAKKLAAATAAASSASAEARRRSLLGLGLGLRQQRQQSRRQRRHLLAKNTSSSAKTNVAPKSSKDSKAGLEKFDDEFAGVNGGDLDPAAAAAREVRAFLKFWNPLGEKGETAVFFDVTTPLPPSPLPPPLMHSEYYEESDLQNDNSASSISESSSSSTGGDVSDYDSGSRSAGSSTSSAKHNFETFKAAAETGSSTEVDFTRVSPLFYAYLKAVLVHKLAQANAASAVPTSLGEDFGSSGSSSGVKESQTSLHHQAVRVAGVALAPSHTVKGTNATATAGSSSSSAGDSGSSESESHARAPFYYLHEAGLGPNARVRLAPWDDKGEEGANGDTTGAVDYGLEAFSGPFALFSETWLAFRAHAELRLKHRKDLSVRFTPPSGATPLHPGEGTSAPHHQHGHHGKTPASCSFPWAQPPPDALSLSWQRLLLETLTAHRAALFAADFPHRTTMALLRKPIYDVESNAFHATATTSTNSSSNTSASIYGSSSSSSRGLQHEKSLVTRWPGRDVLRDSAPVLPASFAVLPVFGVRGNLEQDIGQRKDADTAGSRVVNRSSCQAFRHDMFTQEWVEVAPSDRRRSSKSTAAHLLQMSNCLEAASAAAMQANVEHNDNAAAHSCAGRRSFIFRNTSTCIREADADAALEAAAAKAAAAAVIAAAKAAKNSTSTAKPMSE